MCPPRKPVKWDSKKYKDRRRNPDFSGNWMTRGNGSTFSRRSRRKKSRSTRNIETSDDDD